MSDTPPGHSSQMTAPPNADPEAPANELSELEALLRNSHDTSVFEALQEFAGRLKKRRQAVFGAPGALLLRPIDCQAAREQGVWPDSEDTFALLQGDIVHTSTAFFMGERLENGYFAVANATCDLVPGRRDYLTLAPVRAVYAPDPDDVEGVSRIKSVLGELLSFKLAQRMYLPPLPGDERNVLARYVDFNGMAQAAATDAAVAERIASLSLIGWRVFGVHLRRILIRAGDSEVALRSGWVA